ncbi:aminotransferase class III-fold pyridoxal phosphate-dependent enzyme [Pelagicoccus mobilis]|uniref:Aminotransferase class III-fold pyridoxal phosphate-dependent enzyme n=1 Tax=Pelagicoccus mobilis TaxID=415221 RepID=A0A934VJU1_9BACT|nr:aminotransferase class III-fold pyridoxal phosphate-dependent enzyme [Pelagicoccus mobilis]MBK1875976.1 aminotransferase class III-fold pyridoxal phosphate-dependent enzyme [Pelagicoccus mobilis]
MTNSNASTVAQELLADSQLQDALKSAVERVASHASQITEPLPPKADRQVEYQEALAEFSEIRAGKLYFPFIGSGIGNGPLVELDDGSVKLDFINGIGAHPFGHSHPELLDTALRAALGDTVMQGNLQQNAEGYRFSQKLLKHANQNGDVFQHCFLSSTGVMAGENMLKIAFQAKQPANRVLAFEKCFAGRTLAFSQITDKAAFRQGLPQTLEVDYVPFYDQNDPEGSTERAVSVLQSHINRYPGKHAAFIYELVQGEGGFYPGSSDFFKALMQVCRENGIMNLCDEVQTFARTPRLYAFQHFGLDQEIDGLWLGKASQTCATLFKSEHKPKPGLLSQTFTSSSTSLAVGERIVDLLTQENYFGADGKILELSNHFEAGLKAISQKNPGWVSGPYGLGAMTAFTPFDGKPEQAQTLVKRLFDKGLMSFIAGGAPTRVRFLWPVGATEKKHIDLALSILEESLSEQAADSAK